MATAAMLNFKIHFRFQDSQLHHLLLHLSAKFNVNRTINNVMAARYVKFKMEAAAMLDFGQYFQFHTF